MLQTLVKNSTKGVNSFPKISIITVAYNAEKYIEETILSVINQNYSNIEYIVIDGGSKDSTLNIIRKYEKRITTWVSEPDNGMYDAINKGLLKITGDLWMSLNSDDYLCNNDIISKVVNAYIATEGKYEAYFGNIYRKIGNKFRKTSLFNIDFPILLSSGHCTFFPQPATFLTKKVIEKVGFFDLNYKYASDYDYFLRVLNQFEVMHINQFFTVFREHENSITQTQHILMNAERLDIIKNHTEKNHLNTIKTFVLKYIYWFKYFVKNRPKRYL